ncbi:O-antigen ligase family protein [Streptomyces sp. NPDC127068]|uniref:O-antigen ligase family protein n=1 Tax=Streptomyces sp. NPDC127068 TaxID=3347127 RepID=UPI003660C44A
MSDARTVSDPVGMVLLGVCAGWALMSAAASGGRPEGVLLAVLAVSAAYAFGRIYGALLPVGALVTTALVGLVLAFLLPHVRTAPEGSSPLGHGGATAALLALAAGAACCAAWVTHSVLARRALWALALLITAAAPVLDSMAGLTLCVGILLCSLAAARLARRAFGLGALAAGAAGVAAAAWAVADDALPDGLMSLLEGQLTPYRVLLWRDALEMAQDHPVLGVGPDRFGELSPTVAESLVPDGRPHSALLQQAAEQGFVGVALLALAFGWVLFALLRSPRPTVVAVTAGAALTAVAALAAIGDALSFTAVTVGSGLLAGMATARPLALERW